MKIRDILEKKGYVCHCIAPEQTVREAMDIIAEKTIGALVVEQDGSPKGIITERDIFRLVASKNEAAFDRPVDKFMTTNLVVGLPDDDIDIATAYMTNNHFRHLPIVDFRPYKTGVNIPDNMIIPEGEPTDEYETTLIYEKNSVQKEFTLDNYP